MDAATGTGGKDRAGNRDTARSPRNPWTRISAVLDLLAAGDLHRAEIELESLKFHGRLPNDVWAMVRAQLDAERAETPLRPIVNTPSDYLQLPHDAVLHEFRRFGKGAAPPHRYPLGMVLPQIPGAENDVTFLRNAAVFSQGVGEFSARSLHIFISCDNSGHIDRTIRSIVHQKGSRAVAISVFSDRPPHEIGACGAVPVELCPGSILGDRANQRLQSIMDRGAEVIIFLDGRVILDSSFLDRAMYLAGILDNLVQPLVPASRQGDLQSLFSSCADDSRLRSRYPYEEMRGMNFVVPAQMLKKSGLPDRRFASTALAAREIAYRMHLMGCYFSALPVPEVDADGDADSCERDRALFASVCPDPRVPRGRGTFERPRVSVYIPAYNAAHCIVRAVESVLAQDIEDIEVCIADDGSSDATARILEENFGSDPRIRWETGRNGGIGHASNRAVRMTRAPYIVQLHSDDRLKPGAVSRLMEFLDAHPDVACCYGSGERIDAHGTFLDKEFSCPAFSREMMMLSPIVHHFRMFRRSAWERTTGFRDDITNAVDYDLLLKLSEVGNVHHIDKVMYQRSWYGQNASFENEQAQAKDTYRVQTEALTRTGLRRDWKPQIRTSSAPRNIAYVRRPNRRCVVFWPDYSRANPYQKLLYRSSRPNFDIMAGNIDQALAIVGEFEFPSMLTFHLHWLNFLFTSASTAEKAESNCRKFLVKLESLKKVGVKLIWTVHNVVSHDSAFEDIELRLSEKIAELADIVHFHSHDSIAEVVERFRVPEKKIQVSRHGNFVGVYPDFVTRQQAREQLAIPDNADVLLFFGQVRRYKGVEDLAVAFRRVLADRPDAMLVIAGEIRSDPLESIARNLTDFERSRIRATRRRVDDMEMQVFFRAADLAVLPYKRILTSGSLLLAMSFGVPAITPEVGMTRDVLGSRKAGKVYQPDADNRGLEGAIRELLEAKDAGHLSVWSANARKVAEEYSWPDFSNVLEA